MTTKNTAKQLAPLNPELFVGDARHYELTNQSGIKHVIVSGVNDGLINETYIFPADKDGNILSWGELEGSFRGGVDHELALSNAGYEIIK